MTDLDRDKHLSELVDHSRWLLNNGLANDVIKNQLMTYGAIAHPEIEAVDLTVDMENRTVHYKLYVGSKLLKKINKFKELSTSTGFWGLRGYKKMLLKEGNLHLDRILDKFIKDYCGVTWSATTVVLDSKEYQDGYEDVEDENFNFDSGEDKPAN